MGTGTEIQKHLEGLMPSSNQEKTLELFENIQLTEEETVEGLRAAREKKYYLLKQAEYRERMNRNRNHPTFKARELYQVFEMQFTVDDENVEVITNICKYFANDETFVGNLNRGLFLMGGVGVGKTSLMKFFFKNQRFSYKIESCRDVEANFSQMGENFIESRSFNLPASVNSDPFGHQTIGFCFDDLGTEANSKFYGKEKNVMADIILNRYDNQLPGISTHITTNLTADEIKAQYGTRVTDRIREMFNIIKFPVGAKSRRK
jgi:DNA replication protein DnaC